MKKNAVLFVMMLLLATCANAQSIVIRVNGVHSDEGEVLLMITSDRQGQPAYAKEKASLKGVSFELKNLPQGEVEISVFHDENANFQMDMDDRNRPVEGFARKKISLKEGAPEEIKLTLYYPNWEH